ncbi:hypothetical protein UFOVP393_36 [uncultured Caudovirales phage]|uniref:Portal protein n=1 Tax=uncultured Caudovirales phage TaxID=2100421 RepID=A0A6J7X9V9_9CAUD|nr:hypothetical protein UFOVP393_36 [uncultured Caudovirales phage]
MIDKSLYEAPEGLQSLSSGSDQAIEVDLEVDGDVDIDLGDVEVIIDGSIEDDFDQNLVEQIDEKELAIIVGDLLADYDDDLASRKEWMQTYVDGLQLLGLKIEDRTDPWPGACGVYHPILAEALVKFQAETIMSTFPAAGPVKTQIIGKETPDTRDKAQRVQEDMNYQLTDVMTEFRPEHERMVWGLGLAGNAFKKVYYDTSKERQTSIYVTADDIVVPYGASSIEDAERVTHVMRKTENDLRKLQVSGFYLDVELGEPSNELDEVEKKIAEKMGFRATADNRYKLLEMNVNLDIPGLEHTDEDGNPTGIKVPYIVTIEKGTGTCLSIRRNWRPEDRKCAKRQHFVHYGYVPGFGFYCFGLIHLIGGFAKSGTSILRQLVDAGSLANLPGGFKTRGLRVKGDDTPIAPAEWRDVDVPSGVIKDNIMPLPYKEPSVVLSNLLDKIIEEGRRFASAADMKVADMSANAPVGTTLALLERQLKVMSAVQARIHYSFKQELKLLRDIIRDYTPDEYNYNPSEGNRKAKKGDYDAVDVIPVTDPNASTMAQKVVQYQAAIQLAQMAPQIYDLPQLHRQMLEVLGIKNAAKLVPLEDDETPKDPITENINALKNKPMKAFIFQDHDAHIAAHTMFMQDPLMAQQIAQNPRVNEINAALQAHIAEHLGFHYRAEMEKRMGVTLPSPEDRLPPEVEVELSKLIAQAGAQLLQQNQQKAAQQKAQQTAQDPLVQMQQQELQIKQGELQLKQQKVESDAKAKMAQIKTEHARIESQREIEFARMRSKEESDKLRGEMQNDSERLRLGVDVAKTSAQIKANSQKTQQPNQSKAK